MLQVYMYVCVHVRVCTRMHASMDKLIILLLYNMCLINIACNVKELPQIHKRMHDHDVMQARTCAHTHVHARTHNIMCRPYIDKIT